MSKEKNDALDALYKLEPLFRGFNNYRRKDSEGANSILSQYGYSLDYDKKWKYTTMNNFPTETLVKEMYNFCVKHGENDTDGILFTKRYESTELDEHKKVGKDDVYALIENYITALSKANL